MDDSKLESAEDSVKKPDYKKILSDVKTREKKFADTWWKQADAAAKLYSCDRSEAGKEFDTPYNILYSNTEVLLPSLYSATPKPDTRPRFHGIQIKPIPEVINRFLIVTADPSSPGSESLDTAMADNVLNSLTAGMGFIRLRYYPGRPVPICYESGHYKGLIWGLARKWSKTPWIAFRHEMTRDEIEDKFELSKEEMAKFTLAASDTDEENKDGAPKDSTVVYEYWAKDSYQILYLCDDWEGCLIAEEEDQLKLENRYPTPGPLLLTMKPGKLVPIPLYQYYRNQAEELNRVTVRLNKVLAAIKVRGAYNSLLGDDLAKILDSNETENGLVAASESGLLTQTGGFDKHIWLLPIEKLVSVATQLYQARQQIKSVIYELTGISDIIRGSSVASETATAQDLKNKWGTIRLRKMQKLVADYVRDLFRQTIDCASRVVPAKEWQSITQLGIPLQEEKQLAIQQLQYLQQNAAQEQMQAQHVAQMAQQAGMQPPPPPPPPKPPDPQLLKTAQSPSMEELLKKISADANRTYTVNIQTSSTIDLDTAADKDDLNSFMTAIGQLMTGLTPLVQYGPTGAAAAKQLLVSVAQQFKFGQEMAESFSQIDTQPQPQPGEKGPDPQIEQEKKKLADAQVQISAKQISLNEQLSAIKTAQAELEIQRKEFASEVNIAKSDLAAKGREIASAAKVAAARSKPKSPGNRPPTS